MALQTCFPLSVELWIWSIEPQVIIFGDRSIDVFWGGVDIERPCQPNRDIDYLEAVKYNQPFHLYITPICLCKKLFYYAVIYEKDRKGHFMIREQSLIDFEIDNASFEMAYNRYYGTEDGRPPYLTGCGIKYPYDTKSSKTSLIQQLNIWSFGAETVEGTMFDFVLFDPLAVKIDCSPFNCAGRDVGWYASLVIKDATKDYGDPPPSLLPPGGSPMPPLLPGR